jgi:tungstate transport system substrate-binding protein
LVRRLAVFAIALIASVCPALAQEARFIVMASTTSTEQSGLFGHLLPEFKKATGIDVRVVAQGTGQALDSARRGDADVVFVHDQAAEEKFIADGFGLKRLPVMYNDFVIVGPKADPAGVKGKDVVAALDRIASSGAPFVARPKGYQACGCGMGPALNIGASSNAYVLSDRGTWLNFKNRGELAVLVEGDQRLFNQYGVIAVNPARHPHVKAALARQFVDWVTSPAGQDAIAAYKINGQALFFPNAERY